MLNVSTIIALNLTLGAALITVAWVVGGRFTSNRRKGRPFECGFDPKDSARIPFSIRFFLLSILFLVFDVEVVLLFPIVLNLAAGSALGIIVSRLGFLIVLLGGLFHE